MGKVDSVQVGICNTTIHRMRYHPHSKFSSLDVILFDTFGNIFRSEFFAHLLIKFFFYVAHVNTTNTRSGVRIYDVRVLYWKIFSTRKLYTRMRNENLRVYSLFIECIIREKRRTLRLRRCIYWYHASSY